MGARPSRSPPVGVPPTGADFKITHFCGNLSQNSNAFGGTPKAAGETPALPNPPAIVYGLYLIKLAVIVVWRIGVTPYTPGAAHTIEPLR